MSNIDKQALRQAAEKATPGNWHRASSRFNGITVTPFSLCDEEVMLAHAVEKRDAEFIAAANPATMLALLDENLQLQREKDAIEAVALALRDDMRQAREQLEAAEKRNAEQREYYEGVIADGSKRIAELEAKLETADKLQDSAFRDGLKSGFSYGQTDDQSGFAQCMSAYSTRAGIKVKGE
ncbi:ead/Ea22-like family protein [Salmonella enterica subsp. enterica serovar Panama]|nr:ead/Ea22-like family protein [Salmonella enterica subsp. enterica serovar Panama]EBW6120266.1 ead/Ea22-like family protein [Salmonella enterica subsp. enterica serovar Panama]